MFNQNRLPEKDQESSDAASLVSRITCSAALPDTGKQDTDTDIETTGMSRPCNGFTMLRRVINGQIIIIIIIIIITDQSRLGRILHIGLPKKNVWDCWCETLQAGYGPSCHPTNVKALKK